MSRSSPSKGRFGVKRARVLVALAMLAALAALGAPAASAAPPHVDGQLIVIFKPGADAGARAAAHRRADARVRDRIEAIDAVVVRAADEDSALRRYDAHPAVRSAELDVIARALHDDCQLSDGSPNGDCLVPNDPFFDLQYGLQNDSSTTQPSGTTAAHDADVDGPFAWKRTQGSPDTRIAILDSGIDTDHEDLAAKLVASADFTGSSSVDDKYGHGTAIAGVAGAITGNGTGVAGTGFDASLMSAKVLDDRGIGTCSELARGLIWAADNGAHAANMSLGVPDCLALQDAVDYAWGKGVVMAAAAGNDGDSSATYPAFYSNVIAVAATDNADQKTDFSQHGEWVDLAAPGINVYTTFPNHRNRLGKNDYDYGKGTSVSAPFVAGAAALLWQTVTDENGNGRRNDEVRSRLEAFADDIPGTGTLWSAGRLNACKAAAASLTACPLGGGDSGGDANAAPTASFSFSCADLACDFDGSGSADSDGTIADYSWDFGDGTTISGAAAKTVSHTYSTGGSYTVTLTVTDDDAATGSTSQTLSVSEGTVTGFDLTASGYKLKGLQKVDLDWTGPSASEVPEVDVYRDGAVIEPSTANDGAYTDNIDRRGGGSYTYEVCEAGTTSCSNEVTVSF